jgi:hypothetical protein
VIQWLERRISEEVVGRLLAVLICGAFLYAGAPGAQEALQDTLAVPGAVAAPQDTVSPAPAQPDTPVPEAAPGGAAEVSIYGHVTDANTMPMFGVSVNLFVGGLEEESAVTDSSGAFSITHPIDLAGDETVIAWFTPPRGMGYVREIVVLKESLASAAAGHYGPCVTKATLTPSTFLEVTILDQASYAKKIEELGCMDLAAGMGDVTYELRYSLAAGDTFTLKSSKSDRAVTQIGAGTIVSSSISTDYQVIVESATADGLSLEFEYTDKEATSDAPGSGDVDFSPLIGQKVTLLLSPLGELSRFTGFESLPSIDTGSRTGLDYQNDMRTLFPELPVEAVGRGSSWSSETRFQQSIAGGTMNVTIASDYSVAGQAIIRGLNCLEIDAEYTITMAGQGDMGGTPYTMSLDGSGTGKVYFAYERGMMIESNSKADLTFTTESRGMSTPTAIERETRVEVAFQ